ncbi:MAG: hypothetical protein WAW41_04665 [Methylobacter sp.]
MWPFKPKPIMTAEEYALTRPPAPCGQQTKHIFWTEIEGMKCPVCASNNARELREQDENRLAEKIAAIVVRKMSAP